jgi:hypothetical protein
MGSGAGSNARPFFMDRHLFSQPGGHPLTLVNEWFPQVQRTFLTTG